jgi:hypothetical protein
MLRKVWGGMIHVAGDSDKRQAVVNTAIKLQAT